MDPRQQPGPDRPRLPAARGRLAAPARGLLLVLRLALPRLGGHVARRPGRPTCRGTTASPSSCCARSGPLLLACAVQFFLSFAGLRSRVDRERRSPCSGWRCRCRWSSPAPHHLFVVAIFWYVLLAARADGRDGDLPGRDAAAAAAGLRADGARHRRSARRVLVARARRAVAARSSRRPFSIAECVVPVLLGRRRRPPVPDVRPGAARDRGRPQPAGGADAPHELEWTRDRAD